MNMKALTDQAHAIAQLIGGCGPLLDFGRGMYVARCIVTSAVASACLSLSDGNRKLRRHRVAAYGRDIERGRWHATHQGFAFDTSGKFRDGHHRCQSVIETALSIETPVWFNVPEESLIVVDGGLPRSARDVLLMAGRGSYSDSLLATAKAFEPPPSTMKRRGMTNDELEDVLGMYGESLVFACENLRTWGKGISRSVRALVARAWYHVDRDRLREFCEVLCTGMPQDAKADAAALTFYNLLLREVSGGEYVEAQRYRKGQVALEAFLECRPITKLYGTDKDLFPVVHANEMTAARTQN